MLDMRPDCERCGVDLPPHVFGAHICSLECTFCTPCSQHLGNLCPNCGGELLARPTRLGEALENYPASSERRYRPK